MTICFGNVFSPAGGARKLGAIPSLGVATWEKPEGGCEQNMRCAWARNESSRGVIAKALCRLRRWHYRFWMMSNATMGDGEG
jgi:hypothetical protein